MTHLYLRARAFDKAASNGVSGSNLGSHFKDLSENADFRRYVIYECALKGQYGTACDYVMLFKESGLYDCQNIKPADSAPQPAFADLALLLVKASESCGSNEKCIDAILDIIATISADNEQCKPAQSLTTWQYFMRALSNLPANRIEDEHIDLIEGWLREPAPGMSYGADLCKKLLPNLIESAKNEPDYLRALRLLEVITTVRDNRGSAGPELVVDGHWVSQYVVKTKLGYSLGRHLSVDEVFVFVSSIRHFIPLFKQVDDGSAVWLTSFSDEWERGDEHYRTVLAWLLFDLVGGLLGQEDVNGATVLDRLFGDEFPHPIFKRIAVAIMGGNWKEYGDACLNLLFTQHLWRWIGNPNLRKEIAILLIRLQRESHFTDKQREHIYDALREAGAEDEAINAAIRDHWMPLLEGDDRGKHESWLSLKPSMYRFDQSEESAVDHQTPIDFVAAMAITEPDRFGQRREERELADKLALAVRKDPQLFLNEISFFQHAPCVYIYHLVESLLSTWRDKKWSDWGTLLDFLLAYVDSLQMNPSATGHDQHVDIVQWRRSVTSQIGDLVEIATATDETAIAEAYNDKLLLLLEKIVSILDDDEKADYGDDPVTEALNSASGKIATGVLTLSLYIYRLQRERGEEPFEWDKRAKRLYEELLHGQGSNRFGAVVILGQYLINFRFLDSDWADRQIQGLLKASDTEWRAFFTGFLFGNRNIQNIPPVMRQHIMKALDRKPRAVDRAEGPPIGEYENLLMEHIMYHYLWGTEGYGLGQSGLIKKVIDDWEPSRVERLLKSFRENPEQIPNKKQVEETHEKVVRIWKAICERFKSPEDIGYNDEGILSELSLSADWLPVLDDRTEKWLSKVAPHVQKSYNGEAFIERLQRYCATTGEEKKPDLAARLSRIYEDMVEGFIPEYDMDAVHDTVKFMYSYGDDETRQRVDDIVDKFARRGLYGLRDLWEVQHPAKE